MNQIKGGFKSKGFPGPKTILNLFPKLFNLVQCKDKILIEFNIFEVKKHHSHKI